MGTDSQNQATPKSGTDHVFLDLVVQGPGIDRSLVEVAAGMAGSAAVKQVAPRAFRIRNARRSGAVAAWCEERRIDCAWVPQNRRFADLKLLAMDMDSTLITIECIDELGDYAGRKAEIAAITERAMRGELDFAGALRSRVEALAGLPERALLEVYEERLELTPGAELLVEKCKAHGVKLLLVSGGFTFFTERLKARLGLDYTISNTLDIKDGRLTGKLLGEIVGAEAKAAKFRAVLEELGADRSRSVAIGDGANDLRMMAEAGVSVAFHAHPIARANATHTISHSGLDGVVHLFE